MRRGFTLLSCLIITASIFSTVTPAAASTTTTTNMYVTTKSGQHDVTHKVTYATNQHSVTSKATTIEAFPEKTQQSLSGIGGALTDSSAHIIQSITPAHQKKLLADYFGKSGAQYQNLRLTIGSSDFATHSYEYDPIPANATDPKLNHFTMATDDQNVRPILKQITAFQPNITVYAAPWAPPAWMKVSQNRLGKNFVTNNALKQSAYQPYADYLVKYLLAQQQRGISVRYLSLQNELQANSPWESLTWTPDAAAKFISTYLGPALKKNHLATKVLVWDYVRSNQTQPIMMGFNDWTNFFYAHPEVKPYVTGVGIHWYAANLDPQMVIGNLKQNPAWDDNYENLDRFHEAQPQQHIFATEATQERGVWLGSWTPADHYAHDIINDFNHHVESFLDWNLVLDEHGGPTHQGISNPCSAPINVINAGKKNEKIVKNPAYFVLKRVSRTVQPGTGSIASKSTDEQNVEHTAVKQKDHSGSFLLRNSTAKTQQRTLIYGGTVAHVSLPAHSFTTVTLPFSKGEVHISKKQPTKSNPHWDYLYRHWIAPFIDIFK